jgi:hypothetical protein
VGKTKQFAEEPVEVSTNPHFLKVSHELRRFTILPQDCGSTPGNSPYGTTKNTCPVSALIRT